MVYEEWTGLEAYRIDYYPGTGHVCFITVSWLPGMAGDFRDIRFSDRLGAKLPYHVQASTQFGSATVAVRLGNSPYIYLHYGNGSAISESNGKATFDFFDDFSAAGLDTNAWYVTSGVWSITDGKLCSTSPALYIVTAIGAPTTNNLVFRTRWRMSDTGGENSGVFIGLKRSDSYSTGGYYAGYYPDHKAYFARGAAGLTIDKYTQIDSVTWTPNAWNTTDVCYDGTNFKARHNSGGWYSYPMSGYEGYFGIQNSVRTCEIDYVYARKYAAVEPNAVLIGGGRVLPWSMLAVAYPQPRYVTTVLNEGHWVYREWSESVLHRVNDYPGEGYTCMFSIAWKPGMRGDFADLRFSDKLSSKLPYWIETKTDFTSATVHVRLARSPMVYLHYGNGSAKSESNGDATFELFDHFDGTVLNTAKWEVYTGTSGYMSVSNSEFAVWNRATGGVAPWYGQIRSVATFGTGYEMITKVREDSASDNTFIAFTSTWAGLDGAYSLDGLLFDASGVLKVANRLHPSTALSASMGAVSPGASYRIQVQRPANGSATVILNNGAPVNVATYSWTGAGHVNFANWTGNSGAIRIDWMGVRKLPTTEPTPVRVNASSRGMVYTGEWREHTRESGLSVQPPRVLATPARTLNRDSSMVVKSSSENVDWILGSTRDVRVSVPNICDLTERDLATIRQAGMYIPSVMDNTHVTRRICYRFADFSVHPVKTVVLTNLVYAWPTYPFAVNYEIDGEPVTGKHEIAIGDSVRIVGWLHDTDPFSAVDRYMSFVGYRVKLALYGGNPATLVVKDCNVSSGGRVECKLTSADITVPGNYICKFVVLGVHESVTGYRKELPENRRDWFLLRVNGGG
jgi:hypothetical protein